MLGIVILLLEYVKRMPYLFHPADTAMPAVMVNDFLDRFLIVLAKQNTKALGFYLGCVYNDTIEVKKYRLKMGFEHISTYITVLGGIAATISFLPFSKDQHLGKRRGEFLQQRKLTGFGPALLKISRI